MRPQTKDSSEELWRMVAKLMLPAVAIVGLAAGSAEAANLKVAFVTSYGGDRWRSWLMGDPPRTMAMRWGWVTFGGWRPPTYLALYDMNHATPERLSGFIDKVKRVLGRW